MSEMRAQKLEPCEKPKDAWYPNPCDKYWGFSAGGKCDGCNGDGTRWVTVGTLVAVAHRKNVGDPDPGERWDEHGWWYGDSSMPLTEYDQDLYVIEDSP